ncbi:hypothetical protein POJ06DRAFT_116428 [Lipomyces tetrasporus]|uniref:Mmc1 C-terminal domain-containing protein n=1 Tax=Lipomyces tetrasporus TaxID=54092 RepID=A0AAD7QQZ0_9ASCO|nr:uncharacterized protein POJ06DRAFT_116428 [Lipomyces tetrasporus]KAJ8099770.1 hypothetical protein POJ06DRAFT_116428 [Lipomyces tetrasporus]
MPPVAALRTALAAVQKRFPALGSLQGRAALALASTDPLYPTKVAIIPLDTDRTVTKRVLDSLLLLEMPLSYGNLAKNELEWHDTIKARTLGKDSRVQGTGQLSEKVTNFIQMFGVPSPFLLKHNITFLESVRTPESHEDIYEPCHLHLFVSDSIPSLTVRLPETIIPARRVLDLPSIPTDNRNISSSAIVISTETAESLLPADHDWAQKSNLTTLANVLADRDGLFRNLVRTVIKSCEDYVRASKVYVDSSLRTPAEGDDTRDIVAARKNWARTAHTELRDVLVPGLEAFAKQSTWWKLYWVVDDLEDGIGERTVLRNFLPTAERSLVFVLGRLSTAPTVRSTVSLPTPVWQTSAIQDKIENIGTSVADARRQVKDVLLATLHADAQRLVVSTFLLTQLPVALLAAAGWCWFAYSAYSMSGLALLALVLGFKRVQSRWDALVSAFHTDVHDVARAAIDKAEVEIYDAWEVKVADMETRIAGQQEVVDALKRNIE